MTGKKKLALFVPTLKGGGAERNMIKLANGFAERGYSVDMLLVEYEGPYKKDLSNEVRVVELGGARTITCLPSLIKYLAKENPAAILSTTLFANVITLVAKYLSFTSARIVIRESNNLGNLLDNSSGWRFYLMPGLVRLLYPRADKLVAVSDGVGENLVNYLRILPAKVEVIHHPVVDDELYEMSKQAVEHPFFDQDNTRVILGVGRLTRQKDFVTLIHAFNEVRKKAACKLIILGEGELRPELERLIRQLSLQDEVDLPGFVDNPFKFMRSADLFVLSSRWEGLPGVLIQALACNCRVVSTDCPSGPAEILENGKWGKLVPVGDEAALADAMIFQLSNSVSDNLTERADMFSREKAVEKYVKVMLGN